MGDPGWGGTGHLEREGTSVTNGGMGANRGGFSQTPCWGRGEKTHLKRVTEESFMKEQ